MPGTMDTKVQKNTFNGAIRFLPQPSSWSGSYTIYSRDNLIFIVGARGSLVVKALGYKPDGHGFETR
jgi:hypothetical protein